MTLHANLKISISRQPRRIHDVGCRRRIDVRGTGPVTALAIDTFGNSCGKYRLHVASVGILRRCRIRIVTEDTLERDFAPEVGMMLPVVPGTHTPMPASVRVPADR